MWRCTRLIVLSEMGETKKLWSCETPTDNMKNRNSQLGYTRFVSSIMESAERRFSFQVSLDWEKVPELVKISFNTKTMHARYEAYHGRLYFPLQLLPTEWSVKLSPTSHNTKNSYFGRVIQQYVNKTHLRKMNSTNWSAPISCAAGLCAESESDFIV